MSETDDDVLYWPYLDALADGPWRTVLILLGLLFLVMVVTFVGTILCFWLVWISDRYNNASRERRQRTLERTGSVLMSHVQYVGGHPLIPQARQMVIGLSPSAMTLYSVNPYPADKEQKIRPITSVPVDKILRHGIGRPKTAQEVYDSDLGHSTVEVWEMSPFLRVGFELSGDTYTMSFQQFRDNSPQEWYNQITALSYQLKTKAGSAT